MRTPGCDGAYPSRPRPTNLQNMTFATAGPDRARLRMWGMRHVASSARRRPLCQVMQVSYARGNDRAYAG
jgi:hypothetical protein